MKFYGKSAGKCDPTFERAKTPQENCRTARDYLAPWESFGRTSGPVRKKASNKKTAPLGATKYHESNDQW